MKTPFFLYNNHGFSFEKKTDNNQKKKKTKTNEEEKKSNTFDLDG